MTEEKQSMIHGRPSEDPINFVACLSGGADSITALRMMHEIIRPESVTCICFKYPSKHNDWEIEAANQICGYYNYELIVVDVTTIFAGMSSALINPGKSIPEGHYKEESMRDTVVPMRNIVFASIAASKGMDRYPTGSIALCLGVHQGDHHIYPDCRPQTVQGMYQAFINGSDNRVVTFAPLAFMDKTKIIAHGLRMSVPYHLTRTCYQNSEPCGVCGSCVERLEAFHNNGIPDPITYSRV